MTDQNVLQTFRLPETVTGTAADLRLAYDLVAAWQRDGICQVAMDEAQSHTMSDAIGASRRFFELPLDVKSQHVSELTYSGYIASGEEITAGEADYSEIFTVCKDVPLDDPRVRARWPCHGPVPWPNDEYARSMRAFMDGLGVIGEKVLRLVALGLGLVDVEALTRLTQDGWHHMRVLRFPARSAETSRGIGAHTDYGLLVIAAQDDVGGLYIRPPVPGEKRHRNWLETETSAGQYDDVEPWTLRDAHAGRADVVSRRHPSVPHRRRPAVDAAQGEDEHPGTLRARVLPRAELRRVRHARRSAGPGRASEPSTSTMERISPTCSCVAIRIGSPLGGSSRRTESRCWPDLRKMSLRR